MKIRVTAVTKKEMLLYEAINISCDSGLLFLGRSIVARVE